MLILKSQKQINKWIWNFNFKCGQWNDYKDQTDKNLLNYKSIKNYSIKTWINKSMNWSRHELI